MLAMTSRSLTQQDLKFANETVRKVAIGVGVGAAVGVAAPVVVLGGLALTGFGAGGVVAGVGKIHGVDTMIIANDGTVKGGTFYPITIKLLLQGMSVE